MGMGPLNIGMRPNNNGDEILQQLGWDLTTKGVGPHNNEDGT